MSLTRREILSAGGLALARAAGAAPTRPKRVAAAVTVYTHNSHADVILSRLFQTETLDFRGRRPGLELAAVYVDQLPERDLSRRFEREGHFRLFPSIQEALTLGGERLAVDGVLLIAEHGRYPASPQGHELYPRKRFFDAAIEVFRRSGRAVPLFTDKHLSHSWEEARAMYDTARELRVPLMAGSSIPGTWRRPGIDAPRGAELAEVAAVSYHTLYGYGFHALEMLQAIAERRKGGETGVRRVQCLEGAAAWDAARQGRFDRRLLDAALARLSRGAPADLEARVPRPSLFLIDYRDGLRASVLTLNPAVGEWAVAWRRKDRPEPDATLFWTQEARPLGHFTFLIRGIETLIRTGKPPWPVERTLLTTGMLDRLLTSRHEGGRPLETPELSIRYRSDWQWRDPGPSPPPRPLDAQ